MHYYTKNLLQKLFSYKLKHAFLKIGRTVKLQIHHGIAPGHNFYFPAHIHEQFTHNKIISMFGSSSYSPYSTRSLSLRSNSLSQAPPCPEQQSIRRKVNHIARLNLKDQDVDICACEECIYSRQLNRKRLINLELSKHSSYRSHFKNKPLGEVNAALLSIDHSRIQNNHAPKPAVVKNSNYLNSYTDRYSTKPEKHHPSDQLKFNGPVKGFSSYKEYFPAFRNNASPYVKPVEVSVPNQLKMKVDSSYKSSFGEQKLVPIEKHKPYDNLHSGQPWTGTSTYRQLFTLPQTIDVRSCETGESRVQTKESNYKHQYQTIYRNHYLQSRKQCLRGDPKQENPLLKALQHE